MSGPVSPAEYGAGSTDDELKEGGYAAGLEVWDTLEKAYGDYLGDGTLANSQLWSLRVAVRAEAMNEHRAELDEVYALQERMGDLLTGVANALKGDPGPMTMHDWSDLPAVAKKVAAAAAATPQKKE